MKEILRVEHLSKRFGSLQAIRDLSFEVYENEVIGFAGLSGSGKSVIANLLGGLYPHDTGAMLYKNKTLEYPFKAIKLGIEVIHQVPVLVGALDITTNIFLGYEMGWGGTAKRWFNFPNQAHMTLQARQILMQLGAEFDNMDELVLNLTNEQRQLVAIARAMVRPTNLIVIDEPTVLLGYAFQKRLLSLIQFWKQTGKTIIFNSSNIDHLFAVTDRILVLRNGTHTDTFRTQEISHEDVFTAMIGQTRQLDYTPAISALDSYHRAREKADLLYHQTSLIEKDPNVQYTLNQKLLTQLAIQVKALDQVNGALQNAQRRLLTERERERKHLSRELHDEVIQDLLTANYQLEAIETDIAQGNASKEQLVEVRNTIKDLIEGVRIICGNLRPPTIDSLGLEAAIQSHANAWSKRTGISVELDLELEPRRLTEEIELSIFRIIQEGLGNVYRHSKGTHAKISLCQSWNHALSLTIEDNGSGLPANFELSQLASHGHYGLIGISERVAILGGQFGLKQHRDGGVLMQVEIPVTFKN
jgi:signal transduction histidine kinase